MLAMRAALPADRFYAVADAFLQGTSDRALVERCADSQATVLMWAIRVGWAACVQALVQRHELDVDAHDVWGETALLTAAREGDVAAVRLLMEAGASCHAANSFGWTPLRTALLHGHSDCALLLLDAGLADVDKEDGGGTRLVRGWTFHQWTLLHEACASLADPLPVVRRLVVDHGMGVNTVSAQHARTPLTSLVRHAGEGLPHGVDRASQLASLRLLLAHGADVDLVPTPSGDDDGMVVGDTALVCACAAADAEVVRLLLDAGATVDAATPEGKKVVAACLRVPERAECLRLVLERVAHDEHARAYAPLAKEMALAMYNDECADLLDRALPLRAAYLLGKWRRMVAVRPYALRWQEATVVRQYGPTGRGRVRDRAAFEADALF